MPQNLLLWRVSEHLQSDLLLGFKLGLKLAELCPSLLIWQLQLKLVQEKAGVTNMKSKQAGVTLVELEAVVVILGVLAATAFPRISAFHAVLFGS